MIGIIALIIFGSPCLKLCRHQDPPTDGTPPKKVKSKKDKLDERRERQFKSRRLRAVDSTTLRQIYGDYFHLTQPTPADANAIAPATATTTTTTTTPEDRNGEANNVEVHEVKVIDTQDAPRGPSPDASEYYPCYSSPPRYDTVVTIKNETGKPVCSVNTNQNNLVLGPRPPISVGSSRSSCEIEAPKKLPSIISIHRPTRVVTIDKARRLTFKGKLIYKKRSGVSRGHGIKRAFYRILRSCSENDRTGSHIGTDDFEFFNDSSFSLNSKYYYRPNGDGCESPVYVVSTI